MSAPWTPAEDATLRAAVAGGERIAGILARLPGRSASSITTRLRRLGVEPPGPRVGCAAPTACRAVSPISLCRSCKLQALRDDPAIEAQRAAAAAAYHARPSTKRALAKRIAAVRAAIADDPVKVERRREHGRRQYREHLSRPDVRERNRAPETRARAGARVTETRFADIPREYREHYRFLIRTKRMLAADARACIADLAAADRTRAETRTREARRAIAEIDRRQRDRAERERREAY